MLIGLEGLLHFVGNAGEFGNHALVGLVVDGLFLTCNTQGKHRQHGDLTGKCLGRGDPDFRPHMDVNARLRLARDGGADGVAHAKYKCASLARQFDGCQCVGGFAAL